MKSYKATKRIMSSEYLRGSKKALAGTKLTSLGKSDTLSRTKILSMRSITPEGLATKNGRKHQCSFSYVSKNKTPGAMKSTKYPLKSSFKPSKSSKSREDLRNKKSGSIGTKLAVKSAKILSQAKNRSNTLYSLQCSKSKLEISSSTPSKEPSLHERCRILKRENTCLEKNLEQMQGYKKETELLTKLLLEILPILKAQYNLEEYQSKDFRTGDIACMKSLLSRLKHLKTSKFFSTASSDEDLKLKLKVDAYEKTAKNDQKVIAILKNKEKGLEQRIRELEKVNREVVALKKSMERKDEKLREVMRYNTVLKAKLECFSEENLEPNTDFQPCIISACKYDKILDEEDTNCNKSFESSPEFDSESLMSTDENYIGEVVEKAKQISPLKTSSMCKKTRKLNNKSAIGPRNLELRQCDQSSTTVGYEISSSSHLHRMLGSPSDSIPSQKSSIYRRKYRFMKEIPTLDGRKY